MKFRSVNILMKVNESRFSGAAICFLYCARCFLITFETAFDILKCDHSKKATEQYFPVSCHGVLFIMLYKVVLTFESVVEILKFDHSNESY